MADETKKDTNRPKLFKMQYSRSPLYRNVRADGAWAAITPRREFQITFFNEVVPMPEFAIHEVNASGNLGPEVERVTPDGIYREAEINITLSPESAELIANLIRDLLRVLREQEEKAAKS